MKFELIEIRSSSKIRPKFTCYAAPITIKFLDDPPLAGRFYYLYMVVLAMVHQETSVLEGLYRPHVFELEGMLQGQLLAVAVDLHPVLAPHVEVFPVEGDGDMAGVREALESLELFRLDHVLDQRVHLFEVFRCSRVLEFLVFYAFRLLIILDNLLEDVVRDFLLPKDTTFLERVVRIDGKVATVTLLPPKIQTILDHPPIVLNRRNLQGQLLLHLRKLLDLLFDGLDILIVSSSCLAILAFIVIVEGSHPNGVPLTQLVVYQFFGVEVV